MTKAKRFVESRMRISISGAKFFVTELYFPLSETRAASGSDTPKSLPLLPVAHMSRLSMFLFVILAVATLSAAQIQVTVQGNQGPWDQGLNPGLSYGLDNNADPIVISAASGISFVPGGTITITYVSGQVYPGACGPACVYADANGDTGRVANNISTGPAGHYPSYYMSPYPIYLVELVGTFANNGVIVGAPFAIGDGPATFTIPPGANQLLLGVNDNQYDDNAGSWTLNISSSSTAPPKPSGIQNVITITSLDVSPPICPVPLAANCFSIQQNFYMSLTASPSTPAYWVQNVLVVSLGPLGTEWFVLHAYNIYSTNSNGTTTGLLAGSGQPLVLGTKWSSVSDIGNSPPLDLTATISVSHTIPTVHLEASLEEATKKKGLKPYTYTFPESARIMAATTTEQAQNLSFVGYQLEPELMIVGPELSETVTFNPTTTGTVTAQLRYPGNLWVSPATQYATQSLSNPSLTPNILYCSSTGEQSSGLYWPAGNVSGPVNFQTTVDSGTVQAEGIIFFPASGALFLAACQPTPAS
jgi:hypothetical protein